MPHQRRTKTAHRGLKNHFVLALMIGVLISAASELLELHQSARRLLVGVVCCARNRHHRVCSHHLNIGGGYLLQTHVSPCFWLLLNSCAPPLWVYANGLIQSPILPLRSLNCTPLAASKPARTGQRCVNSSAKLFTRCGDACFRRSAPGM